MARRTGLSSIALVIAMAASALAHHSFAVYDHTRTVTLRGTVTRFQWTNPHGFIEMDVTQNDGTVKHFTVELTSINMMQRVGWRSNMIKAGDKIQVVGAPLLNGDPVGSGARSGPGRWQNDGPAGAGHRKLQANRHAGVTAMRALRGRLLPAVACGLLIAGCARDHRAVADAAGHHRLVDASGLHGWRPPDGTADSGGSTACTAASAQAALTSRNGRPGCRRFARPMRRDNRWRPTPSPVFQTACRG